MTTTLYGKFDEMVEAVLGTPPKADGNAPITFIDLFCGIGGFHVAGDNLGMKCVFASDIDEHAQKAYTANFNMPVEGDIRTIRTEDIPDHDVLFAGFPCQPFSIIGSKRGFADPRGTLWFEIERIVSAKKPRAIVLENVKQLTTANKGAVLKTILDGLKALGYTTDHKILNALDFGLPHKRERTIIVATLDKFDKFPWPTEPLPRKPLSEILEPKPDSKHFVSERIKRKRSEAHTATIKPSIWHENKAGNVSSHPFSCALRAGASYNYLLVDGERRLTPREMLRLQGFPDSYKIVCNDSQTRKQAGNAVPPPMVQAVIERVINAIIRQPETARKRGQA